MKVLIIGARGLLGNFLYNSKELNNKFTILGTTRKKNKKLITLNLLNKKKIANIILKNKIDVIINTSGLVDVDKCNKDYKLAKLNNIDTVKNIIYSLNKIKVRPHLIHFSTDQVYNKYKVINKNYEKSINLVNNYAKSKYFSEKQTAGYKKKTILRTNFFGSGSKSKKISFSEYIISKVRSKKKIKLASNIFFSPINMHYLPKIISKIIKMKIYGTFNLGSSNGCSKYNFGREIVKIHNLDTKYIIPFKSKIKINKRPLGTIMNVSKIEKKFKIKLPTIKKSILIFKK